MTHAADQLPVLLRTCEEAARAGGAQLRAWRGRFSTRNKAPRDLVTDADLASQEAVLGIVGRAFPEHAVLAEEGDVGNQLQQPVCWVVDPLDGTTNYVHGFPSYCVSVGVVVEGELAAGAIYDPIAEECFTAARGQGARLNGETIQVSTVARLEDSLVAISLPPHLPHDSADLRSFLRVAPHSQAVRRTGSAALNLAYVACGRLDAHWAHAIRPWDAAAGVLLIGEAGGVVTGSRGEPFDLEAAHYLTASTAGLHRALAPLMVDCPAEG